MKSRANLCIVPMQDYLELTNAKGRMNTPTIAEGNWQWRLEEKSITPTLIESIKYMAERCGR